MPVGSRREEQSLHQKLTQELTPEEVQGIMEITTSWHNKGRLEGKLEGRLEGRQEIFVKLAQKRFGALPPDILEKIKELSVEQLDLQAERLIEVSSLDELRQAVNSAN
jgi:predicted transposase YdaD